jgi:hypothetical protein
MWMYPEPSYPDRPSSTELSAVEVEAQIHMVLDLGVNLTLCADHVPLWRGIATVRVSTLGPVLVAFAILSFHFTHDLAQGLGGDRGESQDADLSMDVVGREARHATSEETRTWEERDWHAAERAVKR